MTPFAQMLQHVGLTWLAIGFVYWLYQVSRRTR